MLDIILKKRDGLALSEKEIRHFVQGYASGSIPDYQASALLMAIYFQGMDMHETTALTKAMMHSGEVIDLSAVKGVKVDKHSTGGVGDKTSIVLGPLVAAAGVPVAKMSGRGLGHTGGTIDKLESFSGFSVEMAKEDFIKKINEIGIAICGQTANMVPADKKIYALRDVTSTVENMSLIASSIMSKKLACGADSIVLDVKAGCGGFMQDVEQAKLLAAKMGEIGQLMNKKVVSVITDMNQPLGNTVGNALEIKEAIATLKGEGPDDLLELCIELASHMLILGGVCKNKPQANERLKELIKSGAALNKLKEFVVSQGGNTEEIDNPDLLPKSEYQSAFKATEDGFICDLYADKVGRASMILGAGRETKESEIDLAAGIELFAKVGDFVRKGDILATFHTNREEKIKVAEDEMVKAYVLQKENQSPPALIQNIVNQI